MENQKISIELTVAQWNTVMQGVGNTPYIQAADIIDSMKSQAKTQISHISSETENQPS